MRLPETDNPSYQVAFKRGYRHALEGKSVLDMPTDFRRDLKARHYFEMGWQQANDALAERQKNSGKTNWKNRSIWFVFVVISGVLTAKLMINNIESEIAEQQARINPPEKQNNEVHPAAVNHQELRILNPEAYQDLQITAQQFAKQPLIEHTELSSSNLVIESFTITSPVNGKSYPSDKVIPKFERQLAAIGQIKAPNETLITMRWIFQKQVIYQTSFELSKGLNILQSKQAMSSGRQGRWTIELLNSPSQVIYRQEFYYGKLQN